MRFSCLTTVAPGRTLAEQCAAIAAGGCTGVESIVFPATPLDAWVTEFKAAALATHLTPTVVVLGGLALYRPGQASWIAEALEAIAETGAAVLVTPEYRAQDPLPLFPPFSAPTAEETSHVMAAITAMAHRCAQLGLPLYLEPITQFEGRFWQQLIPTAALGRHLSQSTSATVGIVADFHNMNITEADPAAALLLAGQQVTHVHLADNNRRLPGQGHIDFAGALRALRTGSYDGWYSFECAVAYAGEGVGSGNGDFAAALAASIEWLRSL